MPAAPDAWIRTTASLGRSLSHELRALLRGRRRGTPRPVAGASDAPHLPLGKPIDLVVWNVQFCAGRSAEFFYDGGTAVWAEADAVADSRERIAEAMASIDADLWMLQEVDRRSDRTQGVDQRPGLVDAMGLPTWADAPYFNVAYVPHPPGQHLGRVDMRLLTASRYAIQRATSWPLPRLNESAIRRQFNLKRQLFECVLPIEGGGELALLNTHLSAFSRGDGTLGRQVETLIEHIDATQGMGRSVLLGGDFNSLPPSDDPKRLGSHAALYAERASPLVPLFERLQSAVSAEQHTERPERWYTYLPFESPIPDRAIDHVFSSPKVRVLHVEILRDYGDLSDHLPMRVRFQLQD